ncbi:CDP-alcohol phosphatidyltransferase family protein [Anoxynatronum sibiricum]|uniref:CDP-alcohol phosphatidyltransferase family protein n=1 Tax=Anoxynatronum sibiricum TaxID=210623 RepID=A0ABU9VUC6_9CLOT
MIKLIRKLRKEYSGFRSKYVVEVRRQHEYITNRYYAHLIDPFFTKFFYDLGFHPNVVTMLSGTLGVSAGLLITQDHLMVAALLLQLHYLLDGADGNLARLTNQCTTFGAWLDRIFDKVVQSTLILAIAYAADLPWPIKAVFLSTFYFDILIVHKVILPYMRKHPLVRAPWKQWFMDRGLMPAFDIFLIYVITSICLLFQNVEVLVGIIIVGKNLDWSYRLYECYKTSQLKVAAHPEEDGVVSK